MLTKEEAEEVLASARFGLDSLRAFYWKHREHGISCHNTLGQMIYYNLPDWLARDIYHTDKDMYYEENDDEAIQMLMSLVIED